MWQQSALVVTNTDKDGCFGETIAANSLREQINRVSVSITNQAIRWTSEKEKEKRSLFKKRVDGESSARNAG